MVDSKKLKSMINELSSKKQELSLRNKIKRVIHKELAIAQNKHYRTVRNYVLMFSLSLLILICMYFYIPEFPRLVLFLNLIVAVIVFFIGLAVLSTGYKRELIDYVTIEEQISNLKK